MGRTGLDIDTKERSHRAFDHVGRRSAFGRRPSPVALTALRAARVALLVGAGLLGCSVHQTAAQRLPPLAEEAELYVQLEATGRKAARLSLSLAEIDAVTAAGRRWPLALAGARAVSYDGPHRVARGRLPPGAYVALSVSVRQATLKRPEGGSAELLHSGDPGRVETHLRLEPGRIRVVTLVLEADASVDSYAFEPVWHSELPAKSISDQVALIVDRESHALAAVDRRDWLLRDLLPIAYAGDVDIDASQRRGFVSLPSEDSVLVLDLASGEPEHRIQLHVGDEPTELSLTPDGALLICTAPGSQSVLFIDARAGIEVNRVEGNDEPTSVVMGRGGERAYVLNRRGATISVLDVANQALITTLATDPEPLWADFNRAGDTMYVIHRGSPNMTVWSLPALTVEQRIFVGLGMESLRVDDRTDLIYVGMRDEPLVFVYDAFSLAPLETLAVPAPVSFMAVDDVDNALLLLMPDLPAVGVMDLSSRQVTRIVDVGLRPQRAAWIGSRH